MKESCVEIYLLCKRASHCKSIGFQNFRSLLACKNTNFESEELCPEMQPANKQTCQKKKSLLSLFVLKNSPEDWWKMDHEPKTTREQQNGGSVFCKGCHCFIVGQAKRPDPTLVICCIFAFCRKERVSWTELWRSGRNRSWCHQPRNSSWASTPPWRVQRR